MVAIDTPRVRHRAARSQQATAWFLTAPALALMLLILLLPVLTALLLSFTDYSLGAQEISWVGLENYEKLLTRSSYEKMLWATFTYVVVVVPASVGLGLGAALLINSLAHGREIYKTVYFLPVMATLLAMAIVWELMLHPTIGTVNRTLEMGCGTWLEHIWPWLADGCANGMPLWLGDKKYAIWVICFIGIWQGFGFNMVLYLAGLTGVPRDLYNAAEMDGARSAWERFRLVTWPRARPDDRLRRHDQLYSRLSGLRHGRGAVSWRRRAGQIRLHDDVRHLRKRDQTEPDRDRRRHHHAFPDLRDDHYRHPAPPDRT